MEEIYCVRSADNTDKWYQCVDPDAVQMDDTDIGIVEPDPLHARPEADRTGYDPLLIG